MLPEEADHLGGGVVEAVLLVPLCVPRAARFEKSFVCRGGWQQVTLASRRASSTL